MTAPYCKADGVTLYHGDATEISDWQAADVLVTDPPMACSGRLAALVAPGQPVGHQPDAKRGRRPRHQARDDVLANGARLAGVTSRPSCLAPGATRHQRHLVVADLAQGRPLPGGQPQPIANHEDIGYSVTAGGATRRPAYSPRPRREPCGRTSRAPDTEPQPLSMLVSDADGVIATRSPAAAHASRTERRAGRPLA